MVKPVSMKLRTEMLGLAIIFSASNRIVWEPRGMIEGKRCPWAGNAKPKADVIANAKPKSRTLATPAGSPDAPANARG
jgi:hypothetical protein